MTRQCLRKWARRPKADAHIWPHFWQVTAVAGLATLFFLAILLMSSRFRRCVSNVVVPLCTNVLHPPLSWARCCHLSVEMLSVFSDSLSLSLTHFFCPPWCRLPREISPKKSCFGILLLFIRAVCPDQRRWALISKVSIPGILALRRISWLGICSYQFTLRILRRHRRWNWSSFLICRLY